jgi:hypothetical protein
MLKNRLLEVDKNIFFSPGTMDTSDHGTKNDPKGTFELYPN